MYLPYTESVIMDNRKKSAFLPMAGRRGRGLPVYPGGEMLTESVRDVSISAGCYARLAKESRYRVRCGVCERTLAFIVGWARRPGIWYYQLLLDTGWTQETKEMQNEEESRRPGIWRLTKRAEAQLKRGHRPHARREGKLDSASEGAGIKNRAPLQEGTWTPPMLHIRVTRNIPARVQCKCGSVQFMDSVKLGLHEPDADKRLPESVYQEFRTSPILQRDIIYRVQEGMSADEAEMAQLLHQIRHRETVQFRLDGDFTIEVDFSKRTFEI